MICVAGNKVEGCAYDASTVCALRPFLLGHDRVVPPRWNVLIADA